VGPSVGLNAVEKRKIFHCRESNTGPPVAMPTGLSRYIYIKYATFVKVFFVKCTSALGLVTIMNESLESGIWKADIRVLLTYLLITYEILFVRITFQTRGFAFLSTKILCMHLF
jgi:hypothetical protein